MVYAAAAYRIGSGGYCDGCCTEYRIGYSACRPRKETSRLLAPETEADTPSGTEAHARHSGLITTDMLEATADEHQ